jgi:transposase
MSDGDIFEHMIDRAEGDGVRRMDVVVSGGGRRSWTPDVKARIIAESMVPGANVAEVARRNDMLPQHLYMWRRAAIERMAAGSSDDAIFVPARAESSPASGMHAVSVISETKSRNADSAEIGIELEGGTLRIPERASADHIARVLRAVRAAS